MSTLEKTKRDRVRFVGEQNVSLLNLLRPECLIYHVGPMW